MIEIHNIYPSWFVKINASSSYSRYDWIGLDSYLFFPFRIFIYFSLYFPLPFSHLIFVPKNFPFLSLSFHFFFLPFCPFSLPFTHFFFSSFPFPFTFQSTSPILPSFLAWFPTPSAFDIILPPPHRRRRGGSNILYHFEKKLLQMCLWVSLLKK